MPEFDSGVGGMSDREIKRRAATRAALFAAAAKEKDPAKRKHLLISATHGEGGGRSAKRLGRRGAY